jgi:hypothetical protein
MNSTEFIGLLGGVLRLGPEAPLCINMQVLESKDLADLLPATLKERQLI